MHSITILGICQKKKDEIGAFGAKNVFSPASSASRFALTDRSGSLSEPLRTSFVLPLSKNVMSWFSCFLPEGYVRSQRGTNRIDLTLGGNI